MSADIKKATKEREREGHDQRVSYLHVKRRNVKKKKEVSTQFLPLLRHGAKQSGIECANHYLCDKIC